ncbi:MAG: tRNA preQ1(34) S-adenosylmethionine ribosyltransferase-isomerase QueA [Clostridiales Family XIII bacterium]|nr:tRNA preQ1(34) S-adenosylmethionine ribosyltransferase-isomerase QueA [Clostridiales Family XIII bacterium]
MLLSDFDYRLPAELIAKYPSEVRDQSRLMVIHRRSGLLEHRRFHDIASYLRPGDCLVLNDSKVIPARLLGFKAPGGAAVEMLLIKRVDGDVWEAMVRPGKRLRPGDRAIFAETADSAGPGQASCHAAPTVMPAEASETADSAGPRHSIEAEIIGPTPEGTRLVRLHYEGSFEDCLDAVGRMPIPPYIKRDAEEIDKVRYQTVYSGEWGSVAAPTAGLHFTEGLIGELRGAGVSIARVTLHVGPGTFLPVKSEHIDGHHMHFEEYSIPAESAAMINQCKASGGRVICVGTTSVRTLESAARGSGAAAEIAAGKGSTDIFIKPGHSFRLPDGIVTNFHLPKSTLLMLVSAFYDRERMLSAYAEAIEEGYRFFSYGDAMLIL